MSCIESSFATLSSSIRAFVSIALGTPLLLKSFRLPIGSPSKRPFGAEDPLGSLHYQYLTGLTEAHLFMPRLRLSFRYAQAHPDLAVEPTSDLRLLTSAHPARGFFASGRASRTHQSKSSACLSSLSFKQGMERFEL